MSYEEPDDISPSEMAKLEKQIRELVIKSGERRLRLREVMEDLGVGHGLRRTVRRLLHQVMDRLAAGDEGTGDAEEPLPVAREKVRKRGGLRGRIRITSRGFGIVALEYDPAAPPVLPDGTPFTEVFIPRRNLGEALHGDIVRVALVRPRSDAGDLPEGGVSAVLEHGQSRIVGTYYRGKRGGGTVVPRDGRLRRTIIVPSPDPALGAREGAWVVAEVAEWPPQPHPLQGSIVEVLGEDKTPNIDVTLIIRSAGVEPDFPEEVLREAEIEAARTITEDEIERRMDFRTLQTFTIDGATAKDFDDALSIERLPSGLFRLGVHIADVSHYVREGTRLNGEATERATSIYPVDRVIPMLPEALSNDVCSLRPDVDRLTMSCMMDIDGDGRVHEYSIHESVIRSNKRLIYEDVQAVMDGTADPALARSLSSVRLALDDLYALRGVLTAMRFRRGALDLDLPETEIVFEGEEVDYATLPSPSRKLPPRGDRAVAGVVRRSRLESHRVVEECMLLANEVVATHLFRLGVPSVYRVHEPPDLEKLRGLAPALAHLGLKLTMGKGPEQRAVQNALEQAAGLEHGFIARRLILRALMRARYTDENLGHFGLASTCYTHFTSPIRRYPDLLVHRLLRETLQNGARHHGVYAPPSPDLMDVQTTESKAAKPDSVALTPDRRKHWGGLLPQVLTHCSERERRAEDIDRDCTTLKALEYMRGFLGEEFEGIITSVAAFGIFVELRDIPVEGMVPLRLMQGDYYEFDQERMVLTGRRSGDVIKLGDKVIVAVENVDLGALMMDFVITERIRPEGYDPEKQRELHERRSMKEKRQQGNKPFYRGFQQRGGRKRGRR